MNYKLIFIGFAVICFGAYNLYDDYIKWQAMKNNKGPFYKSVLFGVLLILVGGYIAYKAATGQNVL